ncbi:hypothetical protein BCR36DRAFT_445509 [Piromyces finnis]|uniref:Uncharacterized protein n=1 Tax=Piromyces finnis TaxID=1754191 RepID=A0A1Y1UDW8_9FUNG|nr:hypothetical protein BCR36DRAFT_445509 [Piromyces finnis]|eukprot:ORX36189.1 hypothetical protein BCR36DRAFT_445509 [Piromyces finnis]
MKLGTLSNTKFIVMVSMVFVIKIMLVLFGEFVLNGWLQDYIQKCFLILEFELVPNNCWKHPLHENFRYQSILMEEFWSEKHGIDIVGKVWNGAKDRDDPIEAYKRGNKY